MPNELAGFDLIAIQKDLADKLRIGFVQALPDQVWTNMVASEIEAFTKDTKDHRGEFVPSPFRKLLRDKLYKIVDGMLDVELKKPEYQQTFTQDGNGNFYGPGPAVEAIIKRLIPDLVTGLFGQLINASVEAVRQRNSRSY